MMKLSAGTEPLSVLEFAELPRRITLELKKQGITYEEMAMQIGVSLSTFKRMVGDPANAKAINLYRVLKELGIPLWLGN